MDKFIWPRVQHIVHNTLDNEGYQGCALCLHSNLTIYSILYPLDLTSAGYLEYADFIRFTVSILGKLSFLKIFTLSFLLKLVHLCSITGNAHPFIDWFHYACGLHAQSLIRNPGILPSMQVHWQWP